MALVRYIPNKFVDVKYEQEVEPNKLGDILYNFALHYPDFYKPIMYKKSLLFINGKNFAPEECIDYIVKKDDIIEITHSIEEVVTPTWLIISLWVAGTVVTGVGLYFLGGWFLDLFDWDMGDATDDSQTYSWEGPRTSFGAEKPIALIYGEHLIGGQYINFNIWSDGSYNWADILLAMGEGEIAGIVDEDQTGLVSMPDTLQDVNIKDPYIKLNDQLITAYSFCLWAGRTGTNNQTAIIGFRNQKSSFDYAHLVPALRNTPPDQWTTPPHTTNADVDGFIVELSCPALLGISGHGDLVALTIQYRIRYRVNSPQGSWVYSPTVAGGGEDDPDSWYTITGLTKSELKEYKTITTPSRDTYDIQVQRYIPFWDELATNQTLENKLNVTHITEIIDEELAFPNTALEAIRIKATDQLSGSFPNVQTLVRGLKVRVPDLTNGGAGDKEFEDYYWTGTGNNFELLVGSDPVTWDTASYIIQWTSNPVYIIRDLLLNIRYGFGEVVSSSEIDDNSADIAAKKCWQKIENSHKNELNVVIDTVNDPAQVLAQLAQVSRLIIFWSGGYVKFKYEEDEDPVQLFTMANVVKNSFKVDYSDHTKTPNRIEVTFADKDAGWEKSTIEVVDETEWALGKATRTKLLQLIGITDRAQALRAAKFLLNKGRYARKAIEFTTTIEACHSEPGDVIAFQHDVPQWGWGGRVISGTSTTCVIDQDMPQNIIDDPTAYDIKIRHNDDTIETYDIVSVSGRTVTIGGGDTFSPVPVEDELYILGVVDSTIAEYRILNISLTPEEEVQITALEHNANIYSDTGLEISDDESTELPNPAAFAPQVTNLVLSALVNQAGFSISFRQPESTLVWDHADIYISTDDIHYTKIGEGYGDSTIIYTDVLIGVTYYIRVYSINKIGIKNTDPVEANITISGTDAAGTPSSPTGLEIFNQGNSTIFGGRDCKFAWRLNAPFSGAGSLGPEAPAGQGASDWAIIKDFKVEICIGDILLREEFTTDQFYTYTWEKNTEDSSTADPRRSFEIKVYQRSWFGMLSPPATLSVANAIPNMDAITPTLTTGFSNVRVDFSNYYTVDTDLHHYNIYYGTTPPLNASYLETSKTTKSVTVPQLPQEVVYNFQIEPHDLFGVGVRSQVASIEVSALPDDSVGGAQIAEDFVELELYKINFQYISWGQFAVYDDFNDSAKRASPDPSTYDARVYNSKLDNNKDYTADREFGFVSKTYDEITVVASGNVATYGNGYIVDETKDWWTNENKNLLAVDDINATFNIASNTATRLEFTGGYPVASDLTIQNIRNDSNTGTNIYFDCGFEDTSRLIVVYAGTEQLAQYLSGVQVDGKSCSLVATAYNSDSPGACLEMWYIDEDGLTDSAGWCTIRLQGATNPANWGLHTRLYTGVDQSGPTASAIENAVTASKVISVENVDVTASGVAVMGAVEGDGTLTIDNWTSPLAGSESNTPTSAGLHSAGGIEPAGATAKTYALTFTTDANRGAGIVGAWDHDTVMVGGGGTIVNGNYKLRDDNPSYAIAFCTFADSTQGGEFGYVKLEASFDNGSNYQTFLDTETGTNLLGGTVLVADSGDDYIVRITLKNDGAGYGPEVYGFLIGTDPSPWRF